MIFKCNHSNVLAAVCRLILALRTLFWRSLCGQQILVGPLALAVWSCQQLVHLQASFERNQRHDITHCEMWKTMAFLEDTNAHYRSIDMLC